MSVYHKDLENRFSQVFLNQYHAVVDASRISFLFVLTLCLKVTALLQPPNVDA